MLRNSPADIAIRSARMEKSGAQSRRRMGYPRNTISPNLMGAMVHSFFAVSATAGYGLASVDVLSTLLERTLVAPHTLLQGEIARGSPVLAIAVIVNRG